MDAFGEALRQVSAKQGWAKVDEVRRAHGSMVVDALLSKGYAVIDPADDTLQLTEVGALAAKDLRR
jgi:hypothetical protein